MSIGASRWYDGYALEVLLQMLLSIPPCKGGDDLKAADAKQDTSR